MAAAALLILETATVDPILRGPVQVGLLDASGAHLVPAERAAAAVSRLRDGQAAVSAALAEAARLVDGHPGPEDRG